MLCGRWGRAGIGHLGYDPTQEARFTCESVPSLWADFCLAQEMGCGVG